MSYSRLIMIASAVLCAGPAHAVVTGDAASCAAGKPSVLVHVSGIKQGSGRLKLSIYGADRDRWLAKQGRIAKLKVPVTGTAMDVCVAVPAAGRYAVAVHHDFNLDGKRDGADGGGYSRNPKVTLFDPKPDFEQAAFAVGKGPARVQVTMLYLHGLKVAPWVS
ncbi:DUF2141 domain-containing protein [Sphingomonas jaspsi]|uniref:DUF2141 domain-containing protein n=1 Tax=Sphingomonas jaspsi TaxID=392409 RepID=UPI0004B42684|nr:DUF2141 domain-containing protein [Sphingomonas jaspsi]